MSYLVSAYTMANDLGKAEDVLNRMVEMEPDHIATGLTRVNLLFMLDKDAEVITDCLHVIELEPSNHVAYFMMAKAKKATNDVFGAIADLTRSISLKEDFADAYLLRAEILLGLDKLKRRCRCGESDRDRAGGGKFLFIERTYSYGFRGYRGREF